MSHKHQNTTHEERARKGLDRRVVRDEDDHPAETPRQASVYEEPPRTQQTSRSHASPPSHGLRPAGYELGGFGGGPGDRSWQEPWTGNHGLSSFSEMADRGDTGSAPPMFAQDASSTPQVQPPTHPTASLTPQPHWVDAGAVGGAGLGAYHEGVFTLGPFFSGKWNYPTQTPVATAGIPPATPHQVAITPGNLATQVVVPVPIQTTAPAGGGFRGRGPKGYQRSDERILEDVSEWLMHDDFVDASEIEVTVKAGEVTLNGHVPDRLMKRRAEDLVDQLSGVKHLQNNLRLTSE